MEAITIARAGEDEAAACLSLMPQAAGWPMELLVARRGGAIVGAAALLWRNERHPAGFALWAHVIQPERRRGVGRFLLDAATRLALDDADGLWAPEPVAEDAPAAAFLRACGFEAQRREFHFEATTSALLAEIGPMAERLRRRARLPEGLSLAPLSAALVPPVAALVARELDSPPAAVANRLVSYVEHPEATADRSRVAILDGAVEGVILWRAWEETALVEAWTVQPRSRQGWLSVILMEDTLLRCRAEGLERVRFSCNEDVRATIAFAHRRGAVERERRAWFYLALNEETTPAEA